MSTWQVGQEFTAEITGLTHEGAGVGRVDDRVIFVPEALPGDLIRLKLVHIKERLAYGELVEILQASPDRVKPWCTHAANCGGCQLQHLNYDAQLRWKQQQVQDALERIGKLSAEVLPTLGMEDPLQYRNKAQFPLGLANGEVVMGFFKKGTHEIVDLGECQIQHPLLTKLALALKDAVRKLGIEPYDEEQHLGVLRHGVIRVSFAQEKLMLILVTRTSDLPKQDELIAELSKMVPELVSVAHNVNPSVTNVILGRETKVIWGEPNLIDSIGQVNYAISPGSFFQVNPVQTKALYVLVRERLDLTGDETVLDLYCGAGTIGLYVASEAKRIIGVETFAPAIADAKYNAQLNGIINAKFLVGKAEKELPKLAKEQTIDRVILDPPRKGCERSLLEILVSSQVPKIVYVSCNPSTFARDLSYLSQHGYDVGSVQPVDMFPWTRHVESVVLMSRVGD